VTIKSRVLSASTRGRGSGIADGATGRRQVRQRDRLAEVRHGPGQAGLVADLPA
jgi:hypothetical protein